MTPDAVLDIAPRPLLDTPPARVGPNAISQLGVVLKEQRGQALARDIFTRAGLDRYFDTPPEHMTDEREAARLHRVLHDRLPQEADALAAAAGRRTADYLLANRIPQPVQWLLRALPAPLAARLLLKAIGRHAWTFAGSGQFRVRRGPALILEIADNPLAIPGCAWHCAVFERLFQVLVSPRARVREIACCARAAPACQFEVSWRR